MSDKFLQRPLDENTSYEQILENRKNIGVIQDEIQNIERGDADFSDGTPTNLVDISTDRKDGPITFRIKDTNGGVHTFEMTDKGELTAENVVITPEMETQKITFDNGKELVFENQDDGKLKLNGIPIYDAYETRIGALKFNSKEVATDAGDLPNLAQVIGLIAGGGVDVVFADGVKVANVRWADKADVSYVDAELSKKVSTDIANETYATKENFNNDEGSNAIFNATNGDEMEFKVGELSDTSLVLKKEGINMFNGQITKTNNATNDLELVNGQEVKALIASSNNGEWKEIYNNGTLTPKTLPDGINTGYSFTGDNSNLDQFTQQGELVEGNDFVAVPRRDLYFSNELTNTFYEFSIVGNFKDIFGGTDLWLEDSILITNNEINKINYKPFIINVKARQLSNNIIYNKEVYEFEVPYLITNKNGVVEIQLAEQINFTKKVFQNSTDTKPTISYGTWLTSNKDFRINETNELSTIMLDDYYTKDEVDVEIDNHKTKYGIRSIYNLNLPIDGVWTFNYSTYPDLVKNFGNIRQMTIQCAFGGGANTSNIGKRLSGGFDTTNTYELFDFNTLTQRSIDVYCDSTTKEIRITNTSGVNIYTINIEIDTAIQLIDVKEGGSSKEFSKEDIVKETIQDKVDKELMKAMRLK